MPTNIKLPKGNPLTKQQVHGIAEATKGGIVNKTGAPSGKKAKPFKSRRK